MLCIFALKYLLHILHIMSIISKSSKSYGPLDKHMIEDTDSVCEFSPFEYQRNFKRHDMMNYMTNFHILKIKHNKR